MKPFLAGKYIRKIINRDEAFIAERPHFCGRSQNLMNLVTTAFHFNRAREQNVVFQVNVQVQVSLELV